MKLFWQDENVQTKIINKLQSNKVLITSTDTVPGLLANVTPQGFDNLNQIKGGRQDKPYIILISDTSKMANFIDWQSVTPEVQKILSACWPGPLTAIFNSKRNSPAFWKSKHGTVAMRCPNHSGLLTVLYHFNGLFSTSANKSSDIQPKTVSDVDIELISCAGLVVDDLNPVPNLQSSTILDFSSFDQDKKIYLLRQGAFDLSKIEEVASIKIYSK